MTTPGSISRSGKTRRTAILLACLLSGGVGCSAVRVEVDSRLTADEALWHYLEGPCYQIRAFDESVAASLAFESSADLLERALEIHQPTLRRVSAGEPADLDLFLGFQVVDRGTGVESYPVYRPRFGGYFGWGYGYGGGVTTEMRTVDLGHHHMLMVSASIEDASAPSQRRVIWEGRADCFTQARSLKQTLPCLAIALASYYGQETDRPVGVRFDSSEKCSKLLTDFFPPAPEASGSGAPAR